MAQQVLERGDWVFALSGDFDIDEATDLARRYFGTLSGTGPTESYKDFQPDPPSTVVTKDVHAGTGDKGSLTFDWTTPIPDRETDMVYADVLTSVLNIRLTDHIREELGASYSPSAFVGINTEPDQLVETYLNVTGDPSTIPEISTFVIDDVTSLATSGPTDDEFDDAIAELNNSYTYFDNRTIGDLLVKAPNEPELIIAIQESDRRAERRHTGGAADLHHRSDAARPLHRGPDRSRLTR